MIQVKAIITYCSIAKSKWSFLNQINRTARKFGESVYRTGFKFGDDRYQLHTCNVISQYLAVLNLAIFHKVAKLKTSPNSPTTRYSVHVQLVANIVFWVSAHVTMQLLISGKCSSFNIHVHLIGV